MTLHVSQQIVLAYTHLETTVESMFSDLYMTNGYVCLHTEFRKQENVQYTNTEVNSV